LNSQLLANVDHLRTQLAVTQIVVQAEKKVIDPQFLATDVVPRSLRLSSFGLPLEQEQLVGMLDLKVRASN
jgi:hypothetical protein